VGVNEVGYVLTSGVREGGGRLSGLRRRAEEAGIDLEERERRERSREEKGDHLLPKSGPT